jgi:serine/threonine-protein kinase
MRIGPGSSVGDYDLVRALGSGGAATVYEAEHRLVGRRVALKLLHPRHGGVDRALAAARFLREARLAAKVRHPHVVGVLDSGEVDGVLYLAMELVEGQTLAQVLGSRAPLSLPEVVRLLLPIHSAVAELHAAGIVHRDIKPSNILLGRLHDVCPKLSDFGVSRLDDGSASMTQSQDLLGTPAYMAPEIVLFAAKAADARSDQYSLGITLYECATGERPFRGETVYDLMHSIVSTSLPPPSSRRSSLPRAFDDVVLRATHKDPDRRFESVAELANALRPFASPTAPRVDIRSVRAPVKETPAAGTPRAQSEQEAPHIAPSGLAILPTAVPPVKVFHRGQEIVVAAVGHVCLVVWRGAVTWASFEQQRSGLAAVVNRYPHRAGFLIVIEPNVKPPDDELRRESTEMLQSHGNRLSCVGCVVEGEGFKAAITRGVLSGMLLIMRNKKSHISFFPKVHAAAEWMSLRVWIPSPAALTSIVEDVRSRIVPRDDASAPEIAQKR